MLANPALQAGPATVLPAILGTGPVPWELDPWPPGSFLLQLSFQEIGVRQHISLLQSKACIPGGKADWVRSRSGAIDNRDEASALSYGA